MVPTLEQVHAAVVDLSAKIDRLLSKKGDWMTLNAAHLEFGISYDEIKAAIASGTLPARPHVARGGHKSYKVRATDMQRLFGAKVLAS